MRHAGGEPARERAEGARGARGGEEAAAARGVGMARGRERFITVEDWLAFQGDGDTRCELIDGRIVAMNPPTMWHGSIANEIGGICRDALRDRFPRRSLQRVGAEIHREPKATASIADIVVTCEPIDENRHLAAEPRLVVEVLS